MSLPSSFSNSHTIGKATPTAISKSYDTVRCNAGKSLHLYRGSYFFENLFYLVWMNQINCKKTYNPTPNPKAPAVHPTAPFQGRNWCNCHPPCTSQIQHSEPQRNNTYQIPSGAQTTSDIRTKRNDPYLWCISISFIFRSQCIDQEVCLFKGCLNCKIFPGHRNVHSLKRPTIHLEKHWASLHTNGS